MNTATQLLERCKELIEQNLYFVDEKFNLLKDIDAYLEKPVEAPCNLDGLAKLGWQAVECSICGSHAMAYPNPVQPTNQYEQAIDDELVNSFLGTKDDFKDAKSALLAIIDWTRQVALDPTVSPEAAKLLEQAKPVQEPVMRIEYDELCYKSKEDDQSFGMWIPITQEYLSKFSNGTTFYTSPQSREPMSEDELFKLCFEYRNAHTRDAEDWWLAIKKLCGIK